MTENVCHGVLFEKNFVQFLCFENYFPKHVFLKTEDISTMVPPQPFSNKFELTCDGEQYVFYFAPYALPLVNDLMHHIRSA